MNDARLHAIITCGLDDGGIGLGHQGLNLAVRPLDPWGLGRCGLVLPAGRLACLFGGCGDLLLHFRLIQRCQIADDDGIPAVDPRRALKQAARPPVFTTQIVGVAEIIEGLDGFRIEVQCLAIIPFGKIETAQQIIRGGQPVKRLDGEGLLRQHLAEGLHGQAIMAGRHPRLSCRVGIVLIIGKLKLIRRRPVLAARC